MEARSFQPAKGHLFATTLTDLLEEYKAISSRQDVEDLAKRYDIDVSKLESLVCYVNSPTVNPDSVKRTLDNEGNEHTTMKVRMVMTL